MRIINNQLYLKPAELRDVVIAHNTLYRLIEIGTWDVIEDDEQGKLIPYNQLRKVWQSKIDSCFFRNCFTQPYFAQLENWKKVSADRYALAQDKAKAQKSLAFWKQDFIHAPYTNAAMKCAQFDWVKSNMTLPNEELKAILSYEHRGKGLTSAKIEEYKKSGSLLNFLSELHPFQNNRAAIHEMGFKSIDEFWTVVREFVAAQQINLPISRRLEDKLAQYQGEGVICLIHRGLGNSNSSKMSKCISVDEQTGEVVTMGNLITGLMQDNRLFSVKEITRQAMSVVNDMGVSLGNKKKGVTYQTINSYQKMHEYEHAIARSGTVEFKKKRELRNNARPVSMPHLQWQMDGTLFSVYCKNESGVVLKLYVVIVMDSHSRAIIGWSIGYSENSNNVFEALKMAVRLTGCVPAEMRTDKGSAFMSGETQSLLKQLDIVHIPSQARNPKSRTVENQQNVWLNKICKYYQTYGGANITAQAANSHRSMEAMLMLKDKYPTDKEMIGVIVDSICIHNAYKNSKGVSASSMLLNPTTARKLDTMDMLNCFAVWRKVAGKIRKYYLSAEGFEMEVNKEKFRYLPQGTEEEQADFLNKYHNNTGFYFKYDPTDMKAIALYVGNGTEGDMQHIGYAELKGLSAQSLRDGTPEENAILARNMRIKKLQLEKATEKGSYIQQLLKSTGVLERGLNFGDVYKEDYAAARVEYEKLVNGGFVDVLLVNEQRKQAKESQQKGTGLLTLNSRFENMKD